MPVLKGLEHFTHLDYIGCVEMPPRVEDPKAPYDYEPWDIYLGPNGGYMLIHFGPTRIDHVCGDRSHWENLRQVRGKDNYTVPIPALKAGYEMALELLERRGKELQ